MLCSAGFSTAACALPARMGSPQLATAQLGMKGLSVLGKGSFCGNAMVDWAAVAKA
jgi:hypothetical protein